MISGRQNHLRPFGQDHGLQDVDHLRNVGQAHAVGMTLENIEIERGDDGIAQRILLIQKSRLAARFRIVPSAPFVDGKGDLLRRIILIHHGAVLGDVIIHPERVRQG